MSDYVGEKRTLACGSTGAITSLVREFGCAVQHAQEEHARAPPPTVTVPAVSGSLEWQNKEVIRYGCDGQRQNGVDIYGKDNGQSAGVQCKGKTSAPPTADDC